MSEGTNFQLVVNNINKAMKEGKKKYVRVSLNREESIRLTNTSQWKADMDEDNLILRRRDVKLVIPENEIEFIIYD